MKVSERITSGANFELILFLTSKSEHLDEFHSAKSSEEKKEMAAFMRVPVCAYLQKVAHSPRCLWQNTALVQESWIPLAASSQSWTREVWEPEGASSWPDWGSSNTHNERLRRPKTQERRTKEKYWSVWNASLLLRLHETVPDLTKIFKLLFQSHAVMWETLLADESVSATKMEFNFTVCATSLLCLLTFNMAEKVLAR